ncbi:MAG: MTAP family purine nucleoside phosphorylase, partial [Chloroflexota bacterium]
MPEPRASIAIIGGSGLYEMEGMEDMRAIRISTPFGNPSDEIVVARLGDREVAFLPRHGRGHRITPTEVNSRANIYALKTLGVERIVSVSAVGSMREDIAPLHAVVPDQLIDRTRLRPNTFFGNGV